MGLGPFGEESGDDGLGMTVGFSKSKCLKKYEE